MNKQILRSLFDYRDGQLYWKVSNSNRIKVGDKAGYLNKLGYVEVRINNKLYLAHRLIYMYHYGEFNGNIDHKDNNCTNNAIENLRIASQSDNMANKKMQSNNKSGYKGVSFCKQTNKWKASVAKEGKTYWLGRFNTVEEANEAAIKGRISIHKEFVNHG